MSKFTIDTSETSHLPTGCQCIGCGAKVSRATGDTGGPGPGDAMICLHCGTVSIMGDDLTFRAPTEEERLALAQDDQATFMQRVALRTIAADCKGRG
jgi:hypothetical protein